MTKLYDVPRHTWVDVNGLPIYFDHIDGMYSFCRYEDGTICHIKAWTEVTVLDNQPPPPKRNTDEANDTGTSGETGEDGVVGHPC